MSEISQYKEGNEKTSEGTTGNIYSEHNLLKWSDVVSKFLDKIIGKDLQVTYTFDNLEIEIPKAYGPSGREIGGAKWRIDGKIVISTELIKKTSPSSINDKDATGMA